MGYTKSMLVLTVVLIALFAVPRVSHATDTTVGWSFYGPAGNYKVELFEVGTPYPSHSIITGMPRYTITGTVSSPINPTLFASPISTPVLRNKRAVAMLLTMAGISSGLDATGVQCKNTLL